MEKEQKGKKQIVRLYKKGEKLIKQLQAIQTAQTAYKNNPTHEIGTLSVISGAECKIKAKLCVINAKLSQVSNKYGCYCEFYEEAL